MLVWRNAGEVGNMTGQCCVLGKSDQEPKIVIVMPRIVGWVVG